MSPVIHSSLGKGSADLCEVAESDPGSRYYAETVIELMPWSDGDLWVAEKILSDPAMMEHLGGAQDREQILDAHSRYLDAGRSGTDGMFTVVMRPDSQVAGNIGYWDKPWRDELVYETGWMIFPEYQGRGLASEALSVLIARLRLEPARRFLHAFPEVGNVPSNALCRRAGFTNLGECDFEYPPGHPLRCNDWRLDLCEAPDDLGSPQG
jgi:RimJ/RimL family protein N-acetyltransferase